MRIKVDLLRIFDKSIISAAKFIVGGAPMFEIAIRNSHKEIDGDRDINPLVRTILRVLEDSYIEFAMANRPDDARP